MSQDLRLAAQISGAAQGLNGPRAIAIYGNYAYVANASGPLTVYDISDINNPTYVGASANNDGGQCIVVSTDGLYVFTSFWSWGNSRTKKYSLANPIVPLKTHETLYGGEEIGYSSGYLYVYSELGDDVKTYRSSDMALMSTYSFISPPDTSSFEPTSFCMYGNDIYIGKWGSGSTSKVMFYSANGAGGISLSKQCPLTDSLGVVPSYINAIPSGYVDRVPLVHNGISSIGYQSFFYSACDFYQVNLVSSPNRFSVASSVDSKNFYIIGSSQYLYAFNGVTGTILASDYGTPAVDYSNLAVKDDNTVYLVSQSSDALVVFELGEFYSSSSSTSSSLSQSQSSLSSSESSSISTSSEEIIAYGSTYYSNFIDINSINNPLVNNNVQMQYSGFFEKDWTPSTIDINYPGNGLKKTINNHGLIFCNDASKLFSFNSGYLGMVLSLPFSITNGVYLPLKNNTSDENEYILWGVNIGKYENCQPGFYAALTPRGIEFTIWTSRGRVVLVDNVSNIGANEDVFYEFMWDSDEIESYLIRIILSINGQIIDQSNYPISEDSLNGLKFFLINTPYMNTNYECIIRSLSVQNIVPADKFYNSSSSSE